MKILLLKPINSVYYVIQPNLGLGYLATIMLDNGHKVQILDAGRERLKWADFIENIRKEKYDLIGIQMFSHELISVKKHVNIIKKYLPDAKIILGGAHISGDPKGTMSLLENIDFGFAGEAEEGIKEFTKLQKRDYSNNKLLGKIPGLVWRKNSKIIVNPRSSIINLDLIKFPAWHLMPPSSYPTAPHGSFCKSPPVAPLIISRGCPFQCTFCAGKSVTGHFLRYRSIKNVFEEIMLLYKKYGVREIHIEDDNFTLKKEYVIEFCNKMISSGLNLSFALPNGIRLDTLDKEVMELMEKAGFYSIAVGIESGADRILNLMKKNLSTKMIKEKIDLIKKYTKMKITGFFLLGYPGETKEEIMKTIDFAKALKIDKASFMFVMPLPGTELWDIYKTKTSKELQWEKFFYYKIVPGMSDVPVESLQRLQKKAFLGFYLRPKIMLGLLKEIKSYAQVKIITNRLLNMLIPPK